MSKTNYRTEEEILIRGCEAINIPFREIDKTGRLDSGKGAIGNILEESWFEYAVNNESKADFSEAGVELKVAPYIHTRNGVRAKERLVCNIINYMQEYKNTFYTSSFWEKCNTILLMSYQYKEGVPKGDLAVDKVTLFKFPIEDLAIIERDWESIITKVRNGKAHELSEGDTLYLGACTKGANATSMRQQPFSNQLAKQRAYSLKQSYMTYVLNSYIFGKEIDEHIITDSTLLKDKSFEDYLLQKVHPYLGKTQDTLLQEFDLKTTAKNVNELLLARMLGLKGKVSKTNEFQKANIVPKTIRINYNGSIRESMSFPAFNFKKLIEEDWESSEFKARLEQTKFLFVVFRFLQNDSLVFDDLVFWNIPEIDLEEVGKVWKRTASILREGVQFRTVGQRTFNNFPKSSENRVAHVRPHAKNSADILELPDGHWMPKQCFWLNNTYIREQLEKMKK